MSEEVEDRLNFYSKYNRVRGRREIDTLYKLIDNNKPAEIHIVNVSLLREERSRKAEAQLTHKLSMPVIPSNFLEHENEQNRTEDLDEINDKLEKLKKLQRQFHKQMDRRERNVKKKRQLKDQKRKQQEKYRDQLINVVDLKPQNSSSLKSSELKAVKNDVPIQEVEVNSVELDFQDYYADMPEVPISNSYINTTPKKNEFRSLVQKRSGQNFVESVDEQGDRKTDSVVVSRINVGIVLKRQTQHSKQQPKKHIQVQLAHSQSQNVIPIHSFENKPFQTEEKEIYKNNIQLAQSNVLEYSPARHLQSIQNNIQFGSADQQKQEPIQHQNELQFVQKVEEGLVEHKDDSSQTYPIQNKQIEQFQNHFNEDQSSSPSMPVANNTGTQEGQSMKGEFEDRVGPIMKKSQFKRQNQHNGLQPSVFYSQTLPSSKLQSTREQVQSIATNALDHHPHQSPNHGAATQTKPENKKSSFKRLMAETRQNLVPRLAISTILNEHINEVLDFKVLAKPACSPLQQSVVSCETPTPLSPPSKAKRVNFKQKIVEQQLQKSYSREGRPAFDKDLIKGEKNRGFLMNFFAEN